MTQMIVRVDVRVRFDVGEEIILVSSCHLEHSFKWLTKRLLGLGTAIPLMLVQYGVEQVRVLSSKIVYLSHSAMHQYETIAY